MCIFVTNVDNSVIVILTHALHYEYMGYCDIKLINKKLNSFLFLDWKRAISWIFDFGHRVFEFPIYALPRKMWINRTNIWPFLLSFIVFTTYSNRQTKRDIYLSSTMLMWTAITWLEVSVHVRIRNTQLEFKSLQNFGHRWIMLAQNFNDCFIDIYL